MSATSIKKFEQPKSFTFTPENLAEAEKIIARYPAGREQSAVMPLLMLAQKQHDNWLPIAAIEMVARMVNMPYIRAHEVASFYTMYNLKPVGKYLLQFCKTTPCMLRGIDKIIKATEEKLGIDLDQTSDDNLFTLKEVECLGACVNAPVVQINDDFVEDLTIENFLQIIDDLKNGKEFKVGSQINRQCSSPLDNC